MEKKQAGLAVRGHVRQLVVRVGIGTMAAGTLLAGPLTAVGNHALGTNVVVAARTNVVQPIVATGQHGTSTATLTLGMDGADDALTIKWSDGVTTTATRRAGVWTAQNDDGTTITNSVITRKMDNEKASGTERVTVAADNQIEFGNDGFSMVSYHAGVKTGTVSFDGENIDSIWIDWGSQARPSKFTKKSTGWQLSSTVATQAKFLRVQGSIVYLSAPDQNVNLQADLTNLMEIVVGPGPSAVPESGSNNAGKTGHQGDVDDVDQGPELDAKKPVPVPTAAEIERIGGLLRTLLSPRAASVAPAKLAALKGALTELLSKHAAYLQPEQIQALRAALTKLLTPRLEVQPTGMPHAELVTMLSGSLRRLLSVHTHVVSGGDTTGTETACLGETTGAEVATQIPTPVFNDAQQAGVSGQLINVGGVAGVPAVSVAPTAMVVALAAPVAHPAVTKVRASVPTIGAKHLPGGQATRQIVRTTGSVTKRTPGLPQTGDQWTPWLAAMGAGLMGLLAALAVVWTRKRRQRAGNR